MVEQTRLTVTALTARLVHADREITLDDLLPGLRDVDEHVIGNRPGDYELSLADLRLMLAGTLRHCLDELEGCE
jgi:hypothetical protein